MPTPPLSPELAQEAFEAFDRLGSKNEAARSLGISENAFRNRLNKYYQYLAVDPAVKDAASDLGITDLGIIKGGWLKTKDASLRFSMPTGSEGQPEDVLDRIQDRLQNILPAPMVKRPDQTRTDIRNFVPAFDVHLSMRVGDYGTAECVSRLKMGMADILDRMAPAECTIILNGGDFTEQNDPSNLTPQSKHPLAVDSEYDDTTDVATDVTAWMIEQALERSDHVIYKALRGNHDPNTARILRAALKQRYRDEDRVTIETDGIEVFAHLWEGNFIAGQHGDLRKKPLEFVVAFATRYPMMWANSVFRELFTGHLHHKNVPLEKDETGMTFNQVRAVAPLGRHSIENMYDSPSEMLGITYRKGGGRLTTVTHGFWA